MRPRFDDLGETPWLRRRERISLVKNRMPGGSSWTSGRMCRRTRSISSAWPGNYRPALPDCAVVTSDSCSCANWYLRCIKIRRGMMCSLLGGLTSMGAAVPYAIAAKVVHPDRPVIVLVGDGAMQMNNTFCGTIALAAALNTHN
jgi:thiamine pyrophosphate-dependent acetolactate synthase large subunit-like protein